LSTELFEARFYVDFIKSFDTFYPFIYSFQKQWCDKHE